MCLLGRHNVPNHTNASDQVPLTKGYVACLRDVTFMMTSSNGNIFRVTGPLCGEFTGHRWIPRTKASDAELWCFSLICARINGWVKNGCAGDLRRHRDHHGVALLYATCLHDVTRCIHQSDEHNIVGLPGLQFRTWKEAILVRYFATFVELRMLKLRSV